MPKKKQKENDAKLQVNMVVQDFEASWNYAQTNYHSTWYDIFKLYNNQRVDEAYKGISNTFVPMIFSTVETLVSALAGSRPRFDFTPTKEEQEQDTRILNALLDHYWSQDKWQSKVDKWIRSSIMYGTGVMYLWWDIDKPRLINIPLRDFFVDPTASSPNDARYMGRRFLTTPEALKDYEYTDENGEMQSLYKNLDQVRAGASKSGQETDREKKDLLTGSTLGKHAKDTQVEVLEYWTKDRVIAVANRDVLIRDDPNPHYEAAKVGAGEDENPEGLMPFIIQRNYQDESLFYGKGEVEPIIGLQEDLNDITNQNKDAISFVLNPMYTLDPQYADWTDKVESLPGAVYPFQAGALQPIQMAPIPGDAFNERLNIKAEIRETTAADLVVKGVSQADGKATATEISAQLNQANQRMAQKISQIENEGYQDLARAVLRMVQLYVKEPQMVRIIGKDAGIEWEQFDPSIAEGDFEPNVQLESTINALKGEEVARSQEMYLALRGDELINQEELVKLTLKRVYDLEPDEIDLLMGQQDIGAETLPLEAGNEQELLDSLGGLGVGL